MSGSTARYIYGVKSILPARVQRTSGAPVRLYHTRRIYSGLGIMK